MKAEIKIVHEGTTITKEGKKLKSVWCVITIDGIEFRRMFYIELR